MLEEEAVDIDGSEPPSVALPPERHGNRGRPAVPAPRTTVSVPSIRDEDDEWADADPDDDTEYDWFPSVHLDEEEEYELDSD
jgi:hypothetical protein